MNSRSSTGSTRLWAIHCVFFFDQFFFSCCLIVLRSFSFLVLVIWFMVSNLWMLDDFSDLASILLRDLGILARILASCERVTRISTFQV